MPDPHRAFRQLQRELNIDDQGRSRRPHRFIRPLEDMESLCTVVYDLQNPDPSQRIRYERPAPPDKPQILTPSRNGRGNFVANAQNRTDK